MNSEIYIGPYIELIETKFLIERECTFNGCTNESCDLHIRCYDFSQKYCGECGSKIATQNKKILKHSLVKDLFKVAKLEQNLEQCGPKDAYLLPTISIPILRDNLRWKGETHRDCFIESPFAFDITMFSPELETAWFNKEFEQYIQLLNEKIGQDKFTIVWGVVDLLS